MRSALSTVLALSLAPAPALSQSSDPAAAQVALGDAEYGRRAEGALAGVALPGPIEAALAHYRAARRAEAAAPLAAARLMRALFFRAVFCSTTPEARGSLLDEARRTGDDAVFRFGTGSESERVARVRAAPYGIDVHFWAAVSWGEWSLARGTLAAARAGAGGRIRELATIVRSVDPAFEQGGGDRLLGRLHHMAPRIPFVTGWVSRRAAVDHLRAALGYGPGNSVNQLFLAEALLDHVPEAREEARALLAACASASPRPEYLVEDAHYAALARARLAALR